MDRETAVESVAHQIASCVHLMLAHTHTTVAGLRVELTKLTGETIDPTLIDDLLAAKNPHAVDLRLLANIGLALGFDWDFKIKKLAEETAEASAA